MPTREAPQRRFLKHNLPVHSQVRPGRPPLGRVWAGKGGSEPPGWGSGAPPVRSGHAARTVGAQEKAEPNGGRAGKMKRKGVPPAPGAARPSPVPRGLRPGPPPARVQLCAGQSGCLPCSALARLSPGKGDRRKRWAVSGRGIACARALRPTARKRMRETNKQTFFFDLLAQPGSHDRRRPASQPHWCLAHFKSRTRGAPSPPPHRGGLESGPLHPPAASDRRILNLAGDPSGCPQM